MQDDWLDMLTDGDPFTLDELSPEMRGALRDVEELVAAA